MATELATKYDTADANQNLNAQQDRLSTRARQIDGSQYYIAHLYQPSTGLSFRAFVPESFSMQLQNHWEPLYGGAEGGGPASSTIGKVAQAAGVSVNLKYLTRKVWVGSDPIDFSFTFLIDAYSSTYEDVEKPVRDLAKMATPYRSGVFLFGPGPDALSDKNRIYLRIGKFMLIDSVVINTVDFTFYSVADKSDGRYMSADINIHLTTNYTPDQDDIQNFFNKGQSGNANLSDANKVPALISKVGSSIENAKAGDISVITNSLIQTYTNPQFDQNSLAGP